jgi:zinc transporter
MDSPVTGSHGNAGGQTTGDGVLPGLVFAFRIESDGRARELPRDESPDVEADDGGWLWLHFNLADNRACQRIAAWTEMPAAARSLLIAPQDHQQLHATADCIFGVFSDLVRDFEGAGERNGYLNFAMTERLVITGRRQPLQSVDALRAALAAGRRTPNAAALIEALIEQATVGIDRLLEELARELGLAYWLLRRLGVIRR